MSERTNDEELAVLSAMFSLRGDVRERIQELVRTFGLKVVVVTSGASSSLIHHDGCWSELHPQPIQIVDTVGAGDAFVAAMTMGLLARMSLEEVHRIAVEVPGYVCSQRGATPLLRDPFRSIFQ